MIAPKKEPLLSLEDATSVADVARYVAQQVDLLEQAQEARRATADEPQQWIATQDTGLELLVTLYTNGALEVAPRASRTSWGHPYPVREV